jgi:hypothetical protein
MSRRQSWIIATAAAVTVGVCAPGIAAANTSNITSPSPGAVIISSGNPAQPAPDLTIAGISDVVSPSTVDILCAYNGTYLPVATSVATNGAGAFSTHVTSASLSAAGVSQGYCTLVAVPHGTTSVAPTNTGPRVFIAQNQITVSPRGIADFYVHVPVGRQASMDFGSIGEYGLDDSVSYGAADAHAVLFYGNDYVSGDTVGGAKVPAAGMVVDGQNAVFPDTENDNNATSTTLLPLTYHASIDPSGRHSVITETDPVALCNTNVTPVGTSPNCTTFRAAGVSVTRTIVAGALPGAGWGTASGQTVITDRWHATDGRRHVVSLLAEEDFSHNSIGFSASWVSALASPLQAIKGFLGGSPPATSTIPRTVGPVTYRTIMDYTGGPSVTNPVGVGTIYPAPSAASWGTALQYFNTSDRLVIPAHGSVARVRIYGFGETYAELARLERFTRDEAVAPRLSVGRIPRATAAATLRISGTMTDPAGIDVVTVNGHRVRVDARGRFASTVHLRRGGNVVTVKVVDSARNQATVVIRVRRR